MSTYEISEVFLIEISEVIIKSMLHLWDARFHHWRPRIENEGVLMNWSAHRDRAVFHPRQQSVAGHGMQ